MAAAYVGMEAPIVLRWTRILTYSSLTATQVGQFLQLLDSMESITHETLLGASEEG